LLRILDRYILREVVVSWLGVTGVLLAILITNQVASVLARAAESGYPRGVVLELIALAVVQNVSVILPVGLLLGVVLALGRLYHDSEMTAAVRLRLLLAQDRPTIQGYDQDEFARRLYYDRPHETSLELFRYARESTSEILDRLTPAEWVREGTHTEAGPYGVESWLKTYAEHAHKHARQIRVVRDAATKKA
jgi:hypothetical protein